MESTRVPRCRRPKLLRVCLCAALQLLPASRATATVGWGARGVNARPLFQVIAGDRGRAGAGAGSQSENSSEGRRKSAGATPPGASSKAVEALTARPLVGAGTRAGARAGAAAGTQAAAASAASAIPVRSLTFFQAMFAGAISRSVAQTCMQPANVVKTLMQGRGTSGQLRHLSFRLLTRGAGAQFVLSLPHGALNFATLEAVKASTSSLFPAKFAGPLLDFFSSAVATAMCSIVSTPQMVLTDRIMAGIYPNLAAGIREIGSSSGVRGFYTGWGPNLMQKIPSYGLTWVFFQQFKALHRQVSKRPPNNAENFMLGAAAAGATVCLMIPLDTCKTRIVTQGVGAAAAAAGGVVPYKGVADCLVRVVREEGVGALYKALTPRLVSVVPMIGIQFGMYEWMKNELLQRNERRSMQDNGGPGFLRPAHQYMKNFFTPNREFINNVALLDEELV